jgi:hypothetical protein
VIVVALIAPTVTLVDIEPVSHRRFAGESCAT